MLVLRSDWQAALPLLTQLGNGVALISCLDSMLGAHSDAVNMQMAPLLAVTITADGCMQRVVIDFAQPLVFCHKDPIVVCFLQTFVCSALHTLLHPLQPCFFASLLSLQLTACMVAFFAWSPYYITAPFL